MPEKIDYREVAAQSVARLGVIGVYLCWFLAVTGPTHPIGWALFWSMGMMVAYFFVSAKRRYARVTKGFVFVALDSPLGKDWVVSLRKVHIDTVRNVDSLT